MTNTTLWFVSFRRRSSCRICPNSSPWPVSSAPYSRPSRAATSFRRVVTEPTFSSSSMTSYPPRDSEHNFPANVLLPLPSSPTILISRLSFLSRSRTWSYNSNLADHGTSKQQGLLSSSNAERYLPRSIFSFGGSICSTSFVTGCAPLPLFKTQSIRAPDSTSSSPVTTVPTWLPPCLRFKDTVSTLPSIRPQPSSPLLVTSPTTRPDSSITSPPPLKEPSSPPSTIRFPSVTTAPSTFINASILLVFSFIV